MRYRAIVVFTGVLAIAVTAFILVASHGRSACADWQEHYRLIVARTGRTAYYDTIHKGPFGEVSKQRPPGCPIPD